MSNSRQGVWQASDARNNFPELMKLALAGEPQHIRHRNGEQVVVICRRDYDALKPTLKEFLLQGGTCADDDDLEAAIGRNRSDGFTALGLHPRDDRG